MLELLLSAGGGGLFGIVGAIGKSIAAYKEKKLIFAHEERMAEQDRLNMEMEMQLAVKQGEIDLEMAESQADAMGLQAAIAAEASIVGTDPWVANLRGSVRPILTYGLAGLAIAMVWSSPGNPWCNDIIFMAMTAVGFWFGDSPKRK